MKKNKHKNKRKLAAYRRQQEETSAATAEDRSTRGHDESKTLRYRAITVNVQIDRDGNPITKQEGPPQFKKTPMAAAFAPPDEQLIPPDIVVRDNPKPKPKEAVILQFKPKVLPVAYSAAHLMVERERIAYTKWAKRKATEWWININEAAAYAARMVQAEESGTVGHSTEFLNQKAIDKANRKAHAEHVALAKEYGEYPASNRSEPIGKVDKETATLIREHKEIQNRLKKDNVVQYNKPTKTHANLGMPTGRDRGATKRSAVRNGISTPVSTTVEWLANNVPPKDWPDDLAPKIQKYLNGQQTPPTTAVVDSGETYRRNVMLNSFRHQLAAKDKEIEDLKLENRQEVDLLMWEIDCRSNTTFSLPLAKENANLKAENAALKEELNHHVWSDAIGRDVQRSTVGNKPTPPLSTLRNQLKTYMGLHRADPIANFMRVMGYMHNATTPEQLKQYMKMRRQHTANRKADVKAIKRIGAARRSTVQQNREFKYKSMLKRYADDHTSRQAVRDVGSLVSNRSVLRKWGSRDVINKQYSHIARRVNNAYVKWWYEQLRLRDEPTNAERMQALLDKPINRVAHKLTSVAHNINKVLQTEVNPFAIRKERQRKEEAADLKAWRKKNNKHKKEQAKAARLMRQAEEAQLAELKRRMKFVR